MKQEFSKQQIPGGIHLCQVDSTISCAACCGLYNAADCTYAGLQQILADRTQRFASLPREADAIDEFGRQVASDQLQNRPLADFHHCPFIGLIGQSRQRPGCLLHPLAAGNQGVDYRGMSYYGAMACRQYFCPSHHHLAPEVKKIVQHLAANWYEYGLVITESILLGALFSQIEQRLAAPLSLRVIREGCVDLQALRNALFVKIDWPYRTAGAGGLCHYFFNDRRYARPTVDTSALGEHRAGWDTIFAELSSGFQTVAHRSSAQRRLEILIDHAADAVRGSCL